MPECVGCACMPAMMGSREHGQISGTKVLQNLKSVVLQSKKKKVRGVCVHMPAMMGAMPPARPMRSCQPRVSVSICTFVLVTPVN